MKNLLQKLFQMIRKEKDLPELKEGWIRITLDVRPAFDDDADDLKTLDLTNLFLSLHHDDWPPALWNDSEGVIELDTESHTRKIEIK